MSRLSIALLLTLVILGCPIDDWRDNRSSVAVGQVVPPVAPTPQPTPAPIPPAPEIAVIATPQVPLGHWVRIKVTTSGTHPRVRVRQVLLGEDTYLPVDDGDDTNGLIALGNGAYVLAWSQGEFCIEADAQTPAGTITAIAKTMIGDPLPPVVIPPGPGPLPPVVKTLADLAGDKAPALAKAYGEMLEAFALFTSVKHFHDTETLLLNTRGLTGHGATAQIAARLNVATLALLQPALEKVVAELGSPSVPDVGLSVVYIYEKDDGGVPPAVGAALSELNALGMRATTFEEDTTDATGNVPDQYAVALVAARQAGLPALVVTAGQRVKKVVKAPTTKEAVLEAAR